MVYMSLDYNIITQWEEPTCIEIVEMVTSSTANTSQSVHGTNTRVGVGIPWKLEFHLLYLKYYIHIYLFGYYTF